MIDTLLINFAENWEKRHRWIIIDQILITIFMHRNWNYIPLLTVFLYNLFQLLGKFPVSNENWKF